MLIKKQYEVLSVQKEKFKVEIEKIKLENIKLQLEISRLNQWAMNENDAIIALNAL
jgi:cell division protein FtsB